MLRIRKQIATIVRHQHMVTTTVLSSFKAEGIIPDVLETSPTSIMKVIYEKAKVELGNELKPRNVKDEPKIVFNSKGTTFYTLCMVDPDAPSRIKPEMREWIHWLVVNIPGECIHKGEVLSQYIGAGPPEKTGLHRYVFLIYDQQKKLNFEERILTNKSAKGRAHFSIQKFAKKYNIGEPVAGNYFVAKWDLYVPILHKQLGMG